MQHARLMQAARTCMLSGAVWFQGMLLFGGRMLYQAFPELGAPGLTLLQLLLQLLQSEVA